MRVTSAGTRRAVRAAVVGGLVWVLAGIPTNAPAQFETGPFAGFGLEAWGSAFSMIYDDPNGPIPAHPTGEMHAAYSLATLTDGPSGHGIGTVFWPGGPAATAGPFIEDSFWDGVEEGSEGQFPPAELGRPELTPRQWPTAAEVFEPGGPHTADVVPFSHAHSTPTAVLGQSYAAAVTIPGLFRAEDGGSIAQTFVGRVKSGDTEFDAARSEVVASINDISITGGPVTVKIDALTTKATVTSDGTTPVIEGDTVIAGLTINGQGFTLDGSGFHAGDQSNPVTRQLNDAALQALNDSGISLTLANAIDTTKKAEGSRSAGGLVVRMQSQRLDEFVSQMPDDIEQGVRANLSTTHDLVLIFGAANVRASAIKSFDFSVDDDFFAAGISDSFDANVLGSSLDSGTFGSSGTGLPAEAPASAGPTDRFVATSPAFAGPVSVEGVAVVSAILGLGLALAASRGMKRLSDTLLAAGSGRSCPLGEDG